MPSNFKYLAEILRREIEDSLFRVGLLCRVFGRGKDEISLSSKLDHGNNKYKSGGKLVQDAIGIRIALYFSEDIESVKNILCTHYIFDNVASTIDLPDNDQFSVSRYNLIFRIPDELLTDMVRSIGGKAVDVSFEVQLRSMLSEGWHEVEHDLRYKCKENWLENDDLSRALNGVMATLETAEWGMRKIFDDLAYRHYKKNNWNAMLQNRLRMRINHQLSPALIDLFNEEPTIAKDIFRVDRTLVIQVLSKLNPRVPVSLDNIVYVWNFLRNYHVKITNLTPELVLESLNLYQKNCNKIHHK